MTQEFIGVIVGEALLFFRKHFIFDVNFVEFGLGGDIVGYNDKRWVLDSLFQRGVFLHGFLLAIKSSVSTVCLLLCLDYIGKPSPLQHLYTSRSIFEHLYSRIVEAYNLCYNRDCVMVCAFAINK